ncbi:hypothetical protein L2K70_04795 [Nocardioides KLBMP 9356]|uniref:Uncharacterized protein n=1 Tax=Nocardioides potassii TaxID=2911371 RepID=A0ABS9HA72_9ACTN|nr:hypothetical protein [Nocardioides potassii]MCF6376913.1 hypothetical protein [Nocardioides potassii]
MIHCLHCHAETTNGLALCELCRRKAETILEVLPVYFRNLARWRPGRSGTSRPVPGSRVLWDGQVKSAGTGDRISDTLDETSNALITWARALVDDRPHLTRLLDRLTASRQAETVTEAQAVAWLCLGFERYLTSISTLDWCGEFVRDLSQHEERLQTLTPLVPGWYAGACRQVVGFDEDGAAVRCGAGTSVIPGLTWVTCGSCGATTYARDHLDVVLAEARGWLARPKPLAEAIVALVDTEASVPRLYDRIRQWANRGDLQPHHQIRRGYTWDFEQERMVVADEQVGHARYRMGDALDLVLRDTRSKKLTAVS